MSEKATNAKLVKLLAVARELHDRFGDVIVEMDDLLGGGVGIGVKLKQVETAWQAAWKLRYRSDYAFQYPKDRPMWKRLLKKFTPDELQDRMVRYIQDDADALKRERHPLGWFEGAVNKYAPVNGSEGFSLEAPEPPTGCTHRPPCKSDAEHTRVRGAEMRA